MTGAVAGIGVRAVLGGAVSKVGVFIRSVPWQVWLGLALAALIGFLAINRSHWIDRAHGDEARLASICASVRIAAANPKLDCKQADAQVRELGKTIATLKGALARQNAAVTALGAKTAQQQQMAAAAKKQAQGRAEAAEAVADRLRRSSLKPTSAGACEPSAALKGQWQ